MAAWTKEGKDSMLTCAILTREAAGPVSAIHNRMPVVLRSAVFDRWLSPDVQKSDDVGSMIASSAIEFEHYPVSTRLNTAKNDDESLIQPAR
jgi:putative SOS response-associated peptidase YedK